MNRDVDISGNYFRQADLADYFGKLISTFFFVHRGCQIERKDGGYVWGRVHYSTLEDLDKAIEKTHSDLKNSISRAKRTNEKNNP